MKEYLTYIYDEKPSWELIPKADIDCYQWEDERKYRPEAYAKMCFVKNEGVYALVMCKESNPRSVYKTVGDTVYKDSCLEVFLLLNGNGYLNIETNSLGVYLSEFGTGRYTRRPISELTSEKPTVTPIKTDSYWGSEIFIPNALLRDLYDDFDTVEAGEYRVNFCKCGDLTEIPHYGTFAPMSDFEHGFHNPELFAHLIVKGRI